MYEVVTSFQSQSLGWLSAGRELSESDYKRLTITERGKVQLKQRFNRNDDTIPYVAPSYDSYPSHSSYDDTPSHNDTFGGFGGGESGGGGSDGGWGDAGGGDGGGGGGD